MADISTKTDVIKNADDSEIDPRYKEAAKFIMALNKIYDSNNTYLPMLPAEIVKMISEEVGDVDISTLSKDEKETYKMVKKTKLVFKEWVIITKRIKEAEKRALELFKDTLYGFKKLIGRINYGEGSIFNNPNITTKDHIKDLNERISQYIEIANEKFNFSSVYGVQRCLKMVIKVMRDFCNLYLGVYGYYFGSRDDGKLYYYFGEPGKPVKEKANLAYAVGNVFGSMQFFKMMKAGKFTMDEKYLKRPPSDIAPGKFYSIPKYISKNIDLVDKNYTFTPNMWERLYENIYSFFETCEPLRAENQDRLNLVFKLEKRYKNEQVIFVEYDSKLTKGAVMFKFNYLGDVSTSKELHKKIIESLGILFMNPNESPVTEGKLNMKPLKMLPSEFKFKYHLETVIDSYDGPGRKIPLCYIVRTLRFGNYLNEFGENDIPYDYNALRSLSEIGILPGHKYKLIVDNEEELKDIESLTSTL